MSDLIDRQALINSFRYDDDGTAWNMGEIIYRLEQFPSVETNDKRMETHACDWIDRQAAIEEEV